MVKDVVSKFKASLKGKPRLWFEIQYPTGTDEPKTVQAYKNMLSLFTTEHNPIGSTKEQQIMAWKNLGWDPTKEKLDDFVYRFRRVAQELGYNVDQQLDFFSCSVPFHLYFYLKDATMIDPAHMIDQVHMIGQTVERDQIVEIEVGIEVIEMIEVVEIKVEIKI